MTDIRHCLKDQKSTTLLSKSVSTVNALFRDSTKGLVLGRFELFIDLIWVGSISNLAQHISDQAFGSDSTFGIVEDVFDFFILFLIA